jgi:type IV pilus assembly protein PilM
MDVLIVAAPKDIVQSRLQACEDAGLEVEAVDIEAFAMYRSLVEADQEHDWSQTTIALVDIGSSRTNISVIANGVFSMTRSIPQGGQTLTDALKGYFKLEEADAEAGKAQLDVRELLEEGGPKENPPLRVLQPHLDDLVREIRRSLNYYQSQQSEGANKGKAIDLLLFTGGGSKMPGLVDYMAHKLSITASSAGIYDNPRFINNGGPQETGLDLAVASGLAMRAHAKAA